MCPNKPDALYCMCNCAERTETKINSYSLFQETREYFEENVQNYIFSEIPVIEPYHIGKDHDAHEIRWYANKWYICNVCGCLWEFNYPDFPAVGFVRKFENGNYVSLN